ncbi:sensor histidine kinase [Marinilongibacter aquaticus]|uniref:sensor histidine kinase n=1 Tax=Marinilongibacter aquaticus TaxID=2975157 RepID=UPI0021BD1F25|nr:sensor histidine kinase [Marinilongibacter aquaticus]UBM58534.1 sensor histidine kinase [Marinilongibacter aquaticus]
MRFQKTLISVLTFLLPIGVSTLFGQAAETKNALAGHVKKEQHKIEEKLKTFAVTDNFDSLSVYTRKLVDLSIANSLATDKKIDSLFKHIFAHKKDIQSPAIFAELLISKGDWAYNYSHIHEALENYAQALALFKNQGDSTSTAYGLAAMYAAEMLSAEGHFNQSLTYFNLANHLFEIQKDTNHLLWAKNGLVILLSNNLLSGEAEKERNEMLKLAYEKSNYDIIANAYGNLAIEKRKLNAFDQEYAYLKKALSAVDKSKSDIANRLKFLIHTMLTASASRLGLKVEADRYFLYLEKQKTDFKAEERMNAYYRVAQAFHFYAHKNYQKSLQKCSELAQYFKNNNEPEGLFLIQNLQVDCLKKENRFQEAFITLDKLKSAEDSIHSIVKINQLLFHKTQFETERKNRRIAEQNAQLEKKDIQYRFRLRTIGLLAFSLLLILLVIYLQKTQKETETKRLQQAKFSRQLIEAQENERSRISKELHDGIGQNLVLLKVSVPENKSQLLDKTLQDMRRFTRNLHPFILEKHGLAFALRAMLDEIDAHSGIFVVQELDKIQFELPKPTALNLYRICQEILSNILKHSQTESLKFTLECTSQKLHIRIQDHGIGFNVEDAKKSTVSLGLKTIYERAQMIDATLSIESETGKGSQFDLFYTI